MAYDLSRMPFLKRWRAELLGALRIVTALVYLQFGTAKLLAVPYSETLSALPPFSLFWIAGWFELLGAPLLLAGFLTGPVAFLLSGEMAIAYFWVHAPKNFFPGLNGGEEAILFCFIFLFMAFAGGGSWGLDAMRKRA